MSDALLPHVLQCDAAPDTISDHRPVILHLQAITPSTTGRGMRRARMHFWKDPAMAVRFQEWLRLRVLEAPTDGDQTLLAWWPVFKRQVAEHICQLDLEHRAATQGLTAAQAKAKAAYVAAINKLDHAGNQVAAMQPVLEARRRYVAAMAATAASAELRARHRWIREGERPSPLLSKLTRLPTSARQIAALRCVSGGMATDGRHMARMMAAYFAAVSAAAEPDAQAQQQVLEAVRLHATRISEPLAAAAGSPTITTREVKYAAKNTRPGTSPGPDGLPAELWRRGGPALCDLLAAVFTAAGRTGSLPQHFLDGVLSPIFKSDDAANLANYRPITLLNTDYRLLAKVLATRLAPVLATVVGAEQTAFLPGRLIGDNIAFLQLLPELLRSNAQHGTQPTSAALAFLDFRKAYDTVLRPFLFAVMEATGAGPGLARWAMLLLSHTAAAANVNGHISAPMVYEAGVRQGCPLSPTLYLFIAWALSCWLKTCPAVGLEVTPGHKVYGMQYADDASPILRSHAEPVILEFKGAMEVFSRASGQQLNVAKSKLLLIGVVDTTSLPSEVGGLKVVQHTTSLGAAFSNEADPGVHVNWQPMMEVVASCYSKIAKLPLSMFGRAHAGAAYGVSKILHHAEHNGVPAKVADQLQRWTTGLVDRGVAPSIKGAASRCTMPGVYSHLLVGQPAQCGFGAMAWRQHCLARGAMLARRYIVWTTADPAALLRPVKQNQDQGEEDTVPVARPPMVRPLWVPLATAILQRLCPASSPALALLGVAGVNPPGATSLHLPAGLGGRGTMGPLLPLGPLSRMAAGLQALGPLVDVGREMLHLGPWCASAPLWGNPYLQLERRADQRTVHWEINQVGTTRVQICMQQQWAMGFAHMSEFPSLGTVSDLLALDWILGCLCRKLAVRPGVLRPSYSERHQTLVDSVLGLGRASLGLSPIISDMFKSWVPGDECCTLAATVSAMVLAIPPAWRKAAAATVPRSRNPPPLTECGSDQAQRDVAIGMIIRRQGWQPRTPNLPVFIAAASPEALTVRGATLLQLHAVFGEQSQCRSEYVACALTVADVALPTPDEVDTARAGLEAAMKVLWKLPWDNVRKETLWRLTVNGVSGAGGHDVCPSRHCLCGWAVPEGVEGPRQRAHALRLHCFWHCPIATAVRAELIASLPAGTRLSCAHVWLLQTPIETQLHGGAWAVVCMAAVEAMAYGRRALWAMSMEKLRRGAVDKNQSRITDFFSAIPRAPLPLPDLQRASRKAAAYFWCLIQDFVCLGACPWELDSSHPFMGARGGKLHLNLPPGFILPGDIYV